MVTNSSEYMKKYYEKNKDKFKTGGSYNKLIKCEMCNKEYSQLNYAKHLKSTKHLDKIKVQEKEKENKQKSEKQLRKFVLNILKEYDLI